IAESADADWADKARKAASTIEGVRDVGDIETELLADIKAAFDAGGPSEISTKDLIAALTANEERPWVTYSKGNPINAHRLGRILRKYGIISEDVRPNGIHARGYKRVHFEETWGRYIAPKKILR